MRHYIAVGDEIMAGGRPSVYETKIKPNLKMIAILKSNGIEMEQIAKTFGVTRQTLYNHMNEVDEFFDTIKNSNDVMVDKLEATLFDLALGRVKTTKVKTVYDSAGRIRSKEQTEDVAAPSLGALIFAITNLAPDKWRNKQEIAVNTAHEETIQEIKTLTDKLSK